MSGDNSAVFTDADCKKAIGVNPSERRNERVTASITTPPPPHVDPLVVPISPRPTLPIDDVCLSLEMPLESPAVYRDLPHFRAQAMSRSEERESRIGRDDAISCAVADRGHGCCSSSPWEQDELECTKDVRAVLTSIIAAEETSVPLDRMRATTSPLPFFPPLSRQPWHRHRDCTDCR